MPSKKKKKAPAKKKAPSGVNKKTLDKHRQRLVEDKTFGLKNKNKSKKVQQYIKQVTNQVHRRTGKGGESTRRQQEEAKKLAKQRQAEADRELQLLFSSLGKTGKGKKKGKGSTAADVPKPAKEGDIGFDASAAAPKLGRRARARQRRAEEANLAAARKKKKEEEEANDPFAGMTLEEKIEASGYTVPAPRYELVHLNMYILIDGRARMWPLCMPGPARGTSAVGEPHARAW